MYNPTLLVWFVKSCENVKPVVKLLYSMPAAVMRSEMVYNVLSNAELAEHRSLVMEVVVTRVMTFIAICRSRSDLMSDE